MTKTSQRTIWALMISLSIASTGVGAQDDYSKEELREIFSRRAALTFEGGIEVRSYDYELQGKRVEALLFRRLPRTQAEIGA